MAVAQILDENLQFINQKFIQGLETTTNTLALGNGAKSTHADQIILQSGGDHTIDAPNDSAGFFVDPVGNVDAGADGYLTVKYNPDNSQFVYENASDVSLFHDGGVVTFKNLPTSDPNNEGQVWNNSGVLNISSG
jgi:hypothetical protein